jgi:hypothetical protein
MVASRMQPASNGSLRATLQDGPMQKDYWHLDIGHLRRRHRHRKRAAAAFANTNRDPDRVPRVLVQWGESRTGTTFQFTALCASAVLLSLSEGADDLPVDCEYARDDKMLEKRVPEQKKAAILTATGVQGRLVIKTHNKEYAMRKAGKTTHTANSATAWLFATTPGLGDQAKYTQSFKELDALGPALASKYAQLLGLTPSQTADLQAYMQRWDALRLCCGTQMSQSYRDYLQNKTSSHVMKGGLARDHSQYCSSLDLDTVEQELMATAVFQQGKDIRVVAHNTYNEPPFTGTYCTQANRIIAEHNLQFNAKLAPYFRIAQLVKKQGGTVF